MIFIKHLFWPDATLRMTSEAKKHLTDAEIYDLLGERRHVLGASDQRLRQYGPPGLTCNYL